MPRLVTASGSSPARLARRPASHKPTRNAIATRTPYVCRNERWKTSGYIRRLPFGPQHIEDQERAADHDRRVRDVERVPVVIAQVEIKKVGDAAPDHAVEDVARGAAE